MSVSVASGVAEGHTCSRRPRLQLRPPLQQKAAPAAEGCAVTEAAGYLDRQRSPTRSTNKAFNSGYTTTSIN